MLANKCDDHAGMAVGALGSYAHAASLVHEDLTGNLVPMEVPVAQGVLSSAWRGAKRGAGLGRIKLCCYNI